MANTRAGDPGAAFAVWLAREHYAHKTQRLYRNLVRRAAAHLEAAFGITLGAATVSELFDFFDRLPESRATRQQTRSALLAFYRFAGQSDGGPAAELPSIPKQPSLPRPIEVELYLALVEAAHTLGGVHEVVVMMLAYTGCRISELRLARWDQLHLNGADAAWWISGKGARRGGPKERRVPLHQVLPPVLRPWRLACGSGIWLFPSDRSASGVISDPTVRRRLYEVCDVAAEGLHVVPHVMRHTAATLWLEGSDNVRAVQELLGHADLSTTQIYTKVSATRLRQVVDTLPTLDDAA